MLQLSILRSSKSSRKAGAPATPEDRAKWPLAKIILYIKMSIRSDFGGAKKDDINAKREVALKRAAEFICGHPKAEAFPDLTGDAAEVFADCILNAYDELQAGIAKRVKNHTDELERREAAGELVDSATRGAATISNL